LEEKDIFRSLGLTTQVGVMVVVSILGCLFLGLWIDGKLHSSPWATLTLIAVGSRLQTRPWVTLFLTALGILVGLVGVYRLSSSLTERLTKGSEKGNS
jgi:F0F1-type ATP synthase assembly protein I